jgi:glycosidase
LPDHYEQNLREIFPEEHAGAFTFFPDLFKEGGWVWTTFHSYQWDLNYANPAVFNRMAEEMLFLANQGVEVLRLDAVAFIWKQMGTSCENLPEAHTLIQAFNAVAQIASPALLFKSEAIVHPDDVVKYISLEECQLSYNPLIMALLWNSLATRKVRLLSQALATRFKINSGTAWVNYVRVHDDIGWTFSDEDAALLGLNGNDHRRFLNEFYRGRFGGSFSRGLPFQENPVTGDCRISGTCASLAGLEKALNEEGEQEVELAIRRIHLLYGTILTIGGIPLIYLGDEIGTLNDYTYRDDPAHERDSRWVHRPRADWEKYKKRNDAKTIEGRVFQGLKQLIDLRKHHAVFAGGELEIIQTENEHVLGFTRIHAGKRAVIFANFSEVTQNIHQHIFEQYSVYSKKQLHGLSKISAQSEITIEPLDFLVFG